MKDKGYFSRLVMQTPLGAFPGLVRFPRDLGSKPTFMQVEGGLEWTATLFLASPSSQLSFALNNFMPKCYKLVCYILISYSTVLLKR